MALLTKTELEDFYRADIEAQVVPEEFPKYPLQTEYQRRREYFSFKQLQKTFNLPVIGTYEEQSTAIDKLLADAMSLDLLLQSHESLLYLEISSLLLTQS